MPVPLSRPEPQIRNSRSLIDEAYQVLEQAKRSGFNRETEAKVHCLLKMAELVRLSGIPVARAINDFDSFGRPDDSLPGLMRRGIERHFRKSLDPASLAFFRGVTPTERMVSADGCVIETKFNTSLFNGRRRGSVTELRDLSVALDTEEARTYSGLAEGGSGSTLVPIGFIPTVFAALKKTDAILEAADWDTCATENGNPTHTPSLTDVAQSAATVAEGGTSTPVNPLFSDISWPEATTWTSGLLAASVQLTVDAPMLAATLAEAFRIRFARGFGASVVAMVLSDAAATTTSANTGVVNQADLLALMKAVDPQYAAMESSGWVMSWPTFLALVSGNLTYVGSGTVGEALYLLHRDPKGHYLLFDRPVFISPSMPAIASGNVPILFGDFKRLLIRNVPSEAVLRRYNELGMPNHQIYWEMLFRADAAIMTAGGSGDNPIEGLTVK